MKTQNSKVVVAGLVAVGSLFAAIVVAGSLAGCAVPVAPGVEGEDVASVSVAPDYCALPDTTAPGCTFEGDSPFWGPGPNTYCPASDGTEWHLNEFMATRYTREPGTHHSPTTSYCDVAPDGRVLDRVAR